MLLTSYLTEKQSAEKHAINTSSVAFKTILQQLAGYNPVIVFGMIEKENKNLFNTAVVVKEGSLIGSYRKTHLLPGEHIFTAGKTYPVFQTDDLQFGINICYDTQFSLAAASIANQGAKLLLCPSNNMMRHKTAEHYKHLHHQLRIERAKETGLWLLSADVTGEREGRIAYGPTSAINPDGEIVAQLPLMETGMLITAI
jgi:predicted amidohydrolase